MARSSRPSHANRSKGSHHKGRPRAGYRKPSNSIEGDEQTNAPIELSMDGLAYDGRGVGRYQGRACFIDGALKGETVKAQITAANNKRVEAKLIKVLEPSAQRVTPKCEVYQTCGGCDLQHLSHEEQIVHKQQIVDQMLSRNAGINETIWHPAIAPQRETLGYKYRRKIRLACYFDRNTQTLSVGFRQAKSKKIVPVRDCQIVTPELQQLLDRLYALIETLHQLPNASTVLTQFAHIECVADTSNTSMSVRLMKALPSDWHEALIQWAEQHELSLWFRIADEPLTQCVGGETQAQLVDGLALHYSPEDFLQVNGAVNQLAITEVMRHLALTDQDRVLDLFSGLGNFTLPAAAQCQSVVAVEAIEAMVLKAQANAEQNGLDNVECRQQDLFDSSAVSWLDQPVEKIILDPPRAGAELMAKNLGRTGAKVIAYVSCNPLSLARDAKLLMEQGYQLDSLTLLDMFPHTSHIETLVIFKV